MRFEDPLWFLLLLPLLLRFVWLKRLFLPVTVRFSGVLELTQLSSLKARVLSRFSPWLHGLVFVLLVTAMARPQLVDSEQEVVSQGVDIMLALDTSESMLAEDFKPKNRLEVALATVKNFIQKREYDQIGLVVFGSEAYTQCPLTMDYNILLGLIDNVHINMAGGGTAIGMAMATALNRLKDQETASKIIVLVTDGENNTGDISPLGAAKLAKDIGVKVYTIGIGKDGPVPIPYHHVVYGKQYTKMMSQLDEKTLREIAQMTGGSFFRADNEEQLLQIYAQIDALEKTEIKTKTYYNYTELFPFLLWLSLFLVVVEVILSNTVFVRIP